MSSRSPNREESRFGGWSPRRPTSRLPQNGAPCSTRRRDPSARGWIPCALDDPALERGNALLAGTENPLVVAAFGAALHRGPDARILPEDPVCPAARATCHFVDQHE